MSLKFQATETTLDKIADALAVFTTSIEAMRHVYPPNSRAFIDATATTEPGENLMFRGIKLTCHKTRDEVLQDFLQVKDQVIDSILLYTDERFGFLDTDEVLVAAQILNPMNWPEILPVEYGVEELNVLQRHFNNVLEAAGYDHEAAIRQWEMVKVVGQRRFPKNLQDFWHKVYLEYSDECRNVLQLAEIVLVLPLNTAVCERTFSIMKTIKTDWRASMEPATLSMLMRIELEGPRFSALEQSTIDAAIEKWWIAGQRAKRPMLKD